MGWSLRQSFCTEPVRLHLSRSGLGCPVGASRMPVVSTVHRFPARVAFLVLLFAACATAPPSPRQVKLDACLKQADRNIITSAKLEPNNRFSYTYRDTGGTGVEIEKLVACMQERAPAYPTVR
jgi:hypothetical protein